MALDDICKSCSKQKRYHSYDNPCVFVDAFAVPETDDDLMLGGFLADLQKQMAALALELMPLKQLQDTAKADIEALDLARRAAVEKRNLIDEKLNTFSKMMEKAERAADLATRRIEQAAAIKAAEKQMLLMADEFDRLTMGAPWREWAYPFQIDDAKIASLSKRCLIGNTMGTGKTLVSQIICDMIGSKKVLVMTPATVMRSFKNEVNKWAPHRTVKIIGGMTRSKRRAMIEILLTLSEMGKGFTVIMNYEAMRKDTAFIEDLKALQFDTIILDEAHAFKDKSSLTFRQVKEIVNGDGWQIPNVFPMTGSPILNKPQDLWPLLNLIDPYGFSDEYYFLRQYCMQDYETHKWKFTTTGLNGLQRKLRDKFIRRTKEQTGISLPEKTITVHDIQLDPLLHPMQHAANHSLNQQAAIFLNDGSDSAMSITTVLALITRKRQMMTLPSGIEWKDKDGSVIFKCDVEESVKLDYIIHPNGHSTDPSYSDPDGLSAEVIEEKQVIFSQFKAPLRELKRRFDLCVANGNPEYTCAIIDGDTPLDRRNEIIADFQSEFGSIRILLGNFKAMGVGITLTAASQMIILDEEWSPGKNEQAYDRIHRFGQEKSVTINILRVDNSVDEWMASLIEDKAALVDGFNNTVPMSASDLLSKLNDGML